MKTKLKNLHGKLLASYWFVPALMCAAATCAAIAALGYDDIADNATHYRWREWIDVNTAEGARGLLSTIAGSTITLAGVIFSITILALSFASSQYGPRLLRNFMRDRPSQVVLGAFVSTYLYCLLVLRTVGNETNETRLPHVAIGGALMLGVATVAVLIFFIHHVARAIQVSSIVDSVGRDLDFLIREFSQAARASKPGEPKPGESARGRHLHPIESTIHGYVQAISLEELLAIATAAEGTIELQVAPGDHVSAGLHVATLFTDHKAVAPDTLTAIRTSVVIGRQRTNEQDLEFPVDQLVEIAVRALSPAMNDPFTAIHCINRLGAGLTQLGSFQWPEPLVRDADGTAKVLLLPMTMERLLRRAFSQILHYGGDNPAITRQVMKVLGQAAERATTQHAAALRSFADTVLQKARARGLDQESPELRRLHELVQRV